MPTQFETSPATRFVVGTRRLEIIEATENLTLNGEIDVTGNGSFWGQDGGSISLRQLSFEVEGETILGAHYINLESRTDDVVLHQTRLAEEFEDATLASGIRRLRRVAPGERYRVVAIARGSLFRDLNVGLFRYDEDRNYLGFASVLEFGWNSGAPHERIDDYIIPEGVEYIGWGAVSPPDTNAPNDLQLFTMRLRRYGEEENLVENAGFEDRLRFWHGNFSRISLEEVAPITGERSLKIQAPTSGVLQYAASPDGRVDQADHPRTFAVAGGERYVVRSTAKAQTDQNLVVRVQPVDESGSLIGEVPVTINIHSGTSATTKSGVYEVPDGVEYITVFAQVDADASERFYILDNVELQLLGSYITERLDETKFISGYWSSPQLNRGGSLTHRLVKIFLQYSCEIDSTIEVQFTPDGWRTATNRRTVRLDSTGDSIGQAIVQANVTGHDVRFRLWLNDKLVSIFGYRTEQYPANQLNILGD